MRAATLDQRIAGVSFGWEGERNGSPSVQRMNGAVVRRNLLIRPRTDPERICIRATAGLRAGWGASGVQPISIVSDETAPSGGGYISRVQPQSSGTTTLNADLFYGSDTPVVTPGESYTQLIHVRSNEPLMVRTQAQYLTSEGGDATSVAGHAVTLVPGLWTPLTMTSRAPATAALLRVDIDSAGAVSYPKGTVLDVDAAIVGGDVYFDGDTTVNAATINGVTPPPRCSESGSHLRSARLDPSQWRWAA